MVVLQLLFAASSLIVGSPLDTLLVSRNDILHRVHDRSPVIVAQREEANALRSDASQAGLASNPQMTAEVPLYTRSLGTWFDVSRHGQFAASISQQLPIAGARSAQSSALQAQADAAEYLTVQVGQYVVRDAAAEYITYIHARRTVNALTHQLDLLQPIIDGMREQLDKGNVAMRDLLRIQAAAYAIDQDRADAVRATASSEIRLRAMSGLDGFLLPTDTSSAIAAPEWMLTSDTDSLVTLAMGRRADMVAAKLDVRSAEQASTASQRRAIPEPLLGVMYDKAGSYAPDYFALTLSVPLPVVDRQQWASEASEARLRAARARQQQVQRTIATDVRSAIARLRSLHQQRLRVDPQFLKRTIELTERIIENYRKGNVSLLEFVDFIETYNESIIRQNSIDAQYAIALDDARIAIGEDLLAAP